MTFSLTDTFLRSKFFLLTLISIVVLLVSSCTKRSLDRDLINAAGTGNIEEIKRQLTLGANVNCRDNTLNSWTPLIWALYNGRDQAVPILLNAGADPNIRDKSGRSPLFYVLRRPDGAPMIRALIMAGADTKGCIEEIRTLAPNDPNRIAFEAAQSDAQHGERIQR
jgi:ankyrin repeat protein